MIFLNLQRLQLYLMCLVELYADIHTVPRDPLNTICLVVKKVPAILCLIILCWFYCVRTCALWYVIYGVCGYKVIEIDGERLIEG